MISARSLALCKIFLIGDDLGGVSDIILSTGLHYNLTQHGHAGLLQMFSRTDFLDWNNISRTTNRFIFDCLGLSYNLVLLLDIGGCLTGLLPNDAG